MGLDCVTVVDTHRHPGEGRGPSTRAMDSGLRRNGSLSEGVTPANALRGLNTFVTPAEAGVHQREPWIPACAGMTGDRTASPRRTPSELSIRSSPRRRPGSIKTHSWIPACAGMTGYRTTSPRRTPSELSIRSSPRRRPGSINAEAWIPACAGMTGYRTVSPRRRPGSTFTAVSVCLDPLSRPALWGNRPVGVGYIRMPRNRRDTDR